MNRDVEANPSADAFLSACIGKYDALVDVSSEIRERGSPEAVLDWVQTVANFAAMHHPGRFSDGKLENLALAVGRELGALPVTACAATQVACGQPRKDAPKRCVLHVATTIFNIGGHTRTILNWIRKDPESQHSLVTTSSTGVEISPVLTDAVSATGGQIFILPDAAPLISRAKWLRGYAASHADLVFLHLAPYDVVPIVAFAEAGGPPVALINLADQCFWLGSTVADSVVHLREIGATTSREIRHTRNDLLLPIPLFETRPDLSKTEARVELGIPESQPMLLTIGRGIKFAPSARHNYFRAARAILDRNPEAHLYVAGVHAKDYADNPDFVDHERMHLLGPVNDVTALQRAADIYLEGFPFGSQTALLESAMPGTPCVPAFAPASPLLATQDFALNGIVDNPANEQEYIDRVSDLVADPQKRNQLGVALRDQVLHFHVLAYWNRMLEDVYAALSKLRHSPVAIPNSPGATRDVDLAISGYHGTRLAGTDRRRVVDIEVRGRIKFAAYFLRQRGFHSDSLRLLRIANRGRRWDSESILYAVKLLPHWLLFTARRTGAALRPD